MKIAYWWILWINVKIKENLTEVFYVNGRVESSTNRLKTE